MTLHAEMRDKFLASVHRWTYCYSFTFENPNRLKKELASDEFFGRPRTSKWHLARGITRELVMRPGYQYIFFPGVVGLSEITGFMTDDEAIANRFLDILENVSE